MLIELAPRRCEDCIHYEAVEDESGLLSGHCNRVDEPVDDERQGAACPDFEPHPTLRRNP